MGIDLGGGFIIDPQAQLRELDRADCEESLYVFLRNAWKYIDPSTWRDGQVVDYVCGVACVDMGAE